MSDQTRPTAGRRVCSPGRGQRPGEPSYIWIRIYLTMADHPSDALFERHAEMCKVFANPKRLKILDLLKDGPYSVGEISEETEIAQPTVSQHLRKMRTQGVVAKRDAGLEHHYYIADDRILDGMETIRQVLLDNLAEESAVSTQEE